MLERPMRAEEQGLSLLLLGSNDYKITLKAQVRFDMNPTDSFEGRFKQNDPEYLMFPKSICSLLVKCSVFNG